VDGIARRSRHVHVDAGAMQDEWAWSRASSGFILTLRDEYKEINPISGRAGL
jgi:hypothetical protein